MGSVPRQELDVPRVSHDPGQPVQAQWGFGGFHACPEGGDWIAPKPIPEALSRAGGLSLRTSGFSLTLLSFVGGTWHLERHCGK